MAKRVPHRSHIKRKPDGSYHYRRRLPGQLGEISISLGTRHFREAEHRATLIDSAFRQSWERAQTAVSGTESVAGVLKEYLRDALEADLQWRLNRPGGRSLYSSASDSHRDLRPTRTS